MRRAIYGPNSIQNTTPYSSKLQDTSKYTNTKVVRRYSGKNEDGQPFEGNVRDKSRSSSGNYQSGSQYSSKYAHKYPSNGNHFRPKVGLQSQTREYSPYSSSNHAKNSLKYENNQHGDDSDEIEVSHINLADSPSRRLARACRPDIKSIMKG
jgi:hypothetical protein